MPSKVQPRSLAKYILRRLTESLGLGVTAAMIYDIKDDRVNPYHTEENFGLVDFMLSSSQAHDGDYTRPCLSGRERV